VRFPAGLLLSPPALPRSAGIGRGISAAAANAVGDAGGFGSGRPGTLPGGFS